MIIRLARRTTSFWPARSAAFSTRRRVSDLPVKAEIEVSAMGRFASVVAPRRGRTVEQRVGSTYGGTHSLAFLSQPDSVLFIAKRDDAKTLLAARKILQYIEESRPELTLVVEEEIYRQLDNPSDAIVPLREGDGTLLPSCIDFVIALGGDGTFLRVASMFDLCSVPPVLGISMGTLGFLMPIHLETFPTALEELLESRASMLLRMRLQCVVTEDGQSVPSTSRELGSKSLSLVFFSKSFLTISHQLFTR
ncbi:NAD+ kinase, partial [Phenoliferia sp. Uapishka_3]